MSKENSVNWLLVGTGDIAKKRVAPALNETENSRIAGLCDPDQTRAREIAKEYGIAQKRVVKILRENDVPMRNRTEAQRIRRAP